MQFEIRVAKWFNEKYPNEHATIHIKPNEYDCDLCDFITTALNNEGLEAGLDLEVPFVVVRIKPDDIERLMPALSTTLDSAFSYLNDRKTKTELRNRLLVKHLNNVAASRAFIIFTRDE